LLLSLLKHKSAFLSCIQVINQYLASNKQTPRGLSSFVRPLASFLCNLCC